MGGKSKARNSRGGAKAAATEPVAAGPVRVLLLRHGQSEQNATGRDMPDPHLTELGCRQAGAWKGLIGALGAEVVLVSPLRRALQTALLAYEGVDLPIEVCRHARELWWPEKANTLSTPEVLHELLQGLPRGSEVCGIEAALGNMGPQTEQASIAALKRELGSRPESCVCIGAHRQPNKCRIAHAHSTR